MPPTLELINKVPFQIASDITKPKPSSMAGWIPKNASVCKAFNSKSLFSQGDNLFKSKLNSLNQSK